MSKIDEQIKELMLKKRRVELLKTILHFVSATPSEDEFSEVRVEVVDLVKSFVDSTISMIEDAGKSSNPYLENEQASLSLEEISVLKEMVQKLKSKSPGRAEAATSTFSEETEPTDPLSFAQKYRHFDSKRVRVQTATGPVLATVVGLNTPQILVKTDTGYTVGFPPKHLELI